jgi:Tfp pilus assembly protein FimT
VSLLLVALLLPVGLLALMLGMERVERSLRMESVSEQLENFLEAARPEEVETFVSQGFAPALDRYWRRRRLSRLRPSRSR